VALQPRVCWDMSHSTRVEAPVGPEQKLAQNCSSGVPTGYSSETGETIFEPRWRVVEHEGLVAWNGRLSGS